MTPRRPPAAAAPPPSAVHRLPFVAEFSVEGECCGTVVNNPGLTGTPAFAAQFSKVRPGRTSARFPPASRPRPRRRPRTPSPQAVPEIAATLPPARHTTRPWALGQVYNHSKLLAVADEEGYVSVVDTAAPLPTEMADDWGPNKPRAQWLAHRNAVFDVAWCNVSGAGLGWVPGVARGWRSGGWARRLAPAVASCPPASLARGPLHAPRTHHTCRRCPLQDDANMLTASGDQTVALWDTGHADQLASFRGHSGSVKAVCPLPAAPAIFASGAQGRGGALPGGRLAGGLQR